MVMRRFFSYIENRPRWLILTVCLVITASIGLLDYVTGDLSLLIFYIIPIFLAAWFLDKADGIFITLLCGAELCAIDSFLAPSDMPLFSVRTWNSIMETLLLIFASYIMATLKNELEQNRKRADDLEAANLELDAFNYSVAHDLRRPLTYINGYSQMIMELYGDKIDLECRRYLKEIFEGTLRMDQLIDALLNFSRVARCDLHIVPIDFSDMVRRIIDEMKMAEPDRKVEVQIDEGITAVGDLQLLRVVLENLINNAWKYTATKAVAFITFGSASLGKTPVYFVRDNGVGFDSSQANKLFVPFQRLHGAHEFTGFGIGLATVQRIIKRHGGKIWAEGEPDKGATFYFTLGVV